MVPRLVKTKKYRNMIERHADMIDESPFNMKDAAREVRSWVNATRPELPPLDVRPTWLCSLTCVVYMTHRARFK